MRKSNIIIVAILVIASLAFLGLWYYLQFNLVDNPLDLVITVVWWVVIVAACVAIHLAEKRRQQKIRTVFIADGMIYNSETGNVAANTQDGKACVQSMRQILSNLDYKDGVAREAEIDKARFIYVVRSPKFSDNGAVWESEVVSVQQPQKPRQFQSAQELTMILSGKHVA